MAALALLVTTSCGGGTDGETIEFAFTGDNIRFVATAQRLAVDWGDDTTEEYDHLDSTAVVHRYAAGKYIL
jgi:hypothetical protein